MGPRRSWTRTLRVVVGVAVAAAVVAGTAHADDGDFAVAYQVNAAHSGFQVDSLLAPPFVRRWHVDLPGTVSYPLIADGMVFVTASGIETTLYALDQRTGRTIWAETLPFYRRGASPAYDSGRVFVAAGNTTDAQGEHTQVQAYAADSGALEWTVSRNGGGISPPPTAANGVVYLSEGVGLVFAFDAATGASVAAAPGVKGGDSSPAVSDSGVFGAYACNQAYRFTLVSLFPVWYHPADCSGGGGKTPVYADGRLFTRDLGGNLVLDGATGAFLRTYTPPNTTALPPAADAERIFTLTHDMFGAQGNRTLTAQTVDAGLTLWTFVGDGGLDTAPIVISTGSDEFVVEGSRTGMLYALDAQDGTVVWSTNVGAAIREPDEFNVPWPGLAAGQGLLVVPAANTLSAYGHDVTAPVLTVPATLTPRATSTAGATVTFDVTATDPDDTASTTCVPVSGTTFPIGATTVGCTAVDGSGNTTTADFLVVVSGQNADCDLTHYAATKGSLVLKNGNLSGCYLASTSLTTANAQNTNLGSAYLRAADLRSAVLSQANLENADLTQADLTAAKLGGADLTGARMTQAILTGVTWNQTTCPDGTNSNADGGTCLANLALPAR